MAQQRFSSSSLKRIGRAVRAVEKGPPPPPQFDGPELGTEVWVRASAATVLVADQRWRYTLHLCAPTQHIDFNFSSLFPISGLDTVDGYCTWESEVSAGYQSTFLSGVYPLPLGMPMRGIWTWRFGDTKPCILLPYLRNEPKCV